MARLVLKKALKRCQISKRELARRMGMKYENVFKLFGKTANPTFKTLATVAKAMGCRIRDLIEE